MKAPAWIFLAVALQACAAGDPYAFRVQYVDTVAELDEACGWSPFHSAGCALRRGSGCEVVALEPRSFIDRERLETLGHEVLHCTHGPVHF